MDKQIFKKEISDLLNNIKEHLDNAIDHDHIPELELSLIINKIEKLHQKAIILQYLTQNNSVDLQTKTLINQPDIVADTQPTITEVKKEITSSALPGIDIRTIIGINEKFQFIHDLFEANANEYNAVINQLNTFQSFAEAEVYFNSIKNVYKWKDDNEMFQKFIALVKQKLK